VMEAKGVRRFCGRGARQKIQAGVPEVGISPTLGVFSPSRCTVPQTIWALIFRLRLWQKRMETRRHPHDEPASTTQVPGDDKESGQIQAVRPFPNSLT
jgi:hypothetical protein